MFENKLLVELYVLSLDKRFEVYIPINDKIGNISNLLSKNFQGMLNVEKQYVLLNLYNGKVYNNNEIIRNSDIKNGSKLLLI